jgi:hypothetical protein
MKTKQEFQRVRDAIDRLSICAEKLNDVATVVAFVDWALEVLPLADAVAKKGRRIGDYMLYMEKQKLQDDITKYLGKRHPHAST